MHKWLLAVLICSNGAFASELNTFVSCDRLIDSNVNSKAQNTMLSAGSIKILKGEAEYKISYEIDQLKFKNTGSILSLNTGCGEKLEFAGPCEETDDLVQMEKSFNDDNNTVVKGIYNKQTSQLEVIHQIGTSSDDKKIISDVILSCH
jgi:hypothetical protein